MDFPHWWPFGERQQAQGRAKHLRTSEIQGRNGTAIEAVPQATVARIERSEIRGLTIEKWQSRMNMAA